MSDSKWEVRKWADEKRWLFLVLWLWKGMRKIGKRWPELRNPVRDLVWFGLIVCNVRDSRWRLKNYSVFGEITGGTFSRMLGCTFYNFLAVYSSIMAKDGDLFFFFFLNPGKRQLISDWSEWAINVSGLLNTKPVLYATPTAYPDISFLNRQ